MTYQGSKVKYAKYICPILQKCIDANHITTFIDCMVGGANIIKNIKCENRVAIDNNKYLIALWKELQKPNFKFPPFPSREDWDRCKNGVEEHDWYIGLTSIFTSYLCRGFPGGYNKQERQYWGRIHTVEKDLPLMQNINFICGDYSDILNTVRDTVIYIDPPYKDTKEYLTSQHFNYNKFWQTVRESSKYNYIFISEQVAPEDFISIWHMDTNRQLQGNITLATENLFIYKEGLAANYLTLS